MRFGGLDSFVAGSGQMQIWLYHLIPVVNASGPEIDQGAAVRFLSEMIWYPMFACSDALQWQPLADGQSAQVTLTAKGQRVSGTFFFTEEGLPRCFEADRYYGESGQLERWLITIDTSSVSSFDGLNIPSRATITWQLPAGDFTWLEMEVVGLSPKGASELHN